MRVTIIGHGFLGGVIHTLLRDTDHELFIHDPPKGIIDNGESDLAIVCAPTPSGPNGECNISAVVKAVKECSAKLILIKSTVTPGTTDMLIAETKKRIAFSPEYMGESKYYVPPQYLDPLDARSHGFMIVGGAPDVRADIIDFFLPVLGPTCRFREMEAKQAELVKYAENSFFALKVCYANELRRICDAMGVSYHAVREGWLDDPRTGPMHTAAFRDSPGFGGKCLPKDISALAYAAREAGYPSALLEAVISVNKERP